jgi:hypothetical protein
VLRIQQSDWLYTELSPGTQVFDETETYLRKHAERQVSGELDRQGELD